MNFRSLDCAAIRPLVTQISPLSVQLFEDGLNLLPMDAHVSARQQMPPLRIHRSKPGMSKLYGGVQPRIFRDRRNHLRARLIVFDRNLKRRLS